MSRSIHGTIGAALLSCIALSSQSQEPGAQPGTPQAVAKSLGLIIYPAKGQTAGQQSADEQQCYDWAKAQTGIDPQAPAPAAAPPESKESKGGQRVRGAARGAAAGAVIGEVADNDAE